MRSFPHLLTEDRPDYERILDEVLRTAHERPELPALGERPEAARLRTQAITASGVIAAAAAVEYDHYVRVREAHRGSPAPSAPAARVPPAPGRGFAAAVLGGGRPASSEVAPARWARMSFGRRLLATLLGLHVRPETPKAPRAPRAQRVPGLTEPRAYPLTPREAPDGTRSGAGLPAVVAVLAPAFAGAAALISLLVGYVLAVLDPRSSLASALVQAGWWFAAVAGAVALVAVVGLVVTAVRAGPPSPVPERADVAEAREAWRNALVERGIVPFLRVALDTDTSTGGTGPVPDPDTHFTQLWSAHSLNRLSALGYPRPNFASPDFTAPDPEGSGAPPEMTRPPQDPT
ncbi:hypothetical protein [Streptomyces sp. NPDC048659]|uniref:hypothetical protein n=1 Tax=Streptomyces sp. NPDC048659 TaxID=3155489 RepID=UPI0034347745